MPARRSAPTTRPAWSRPRRCSTNVEYSDGPYACAEGAHALVIVTEWEQFRALDLDRLKREMASPVIVDLRNVYRPDEMARHDFAYESIGRGKAKS